MDRWSVTAFTLFILLNRFVATDEFMFHEAFTIVKKFIGIATTDTVEALQRL